VKWNDFIVVKLNFIEPGTFLVLDGCSMPQAGMLSCLQLEDEIITLRSVLDAKMREAAELKQKLGITTLAEFKDDFKHGIQVIKESETLVIVAFLT